MAEQDRLGNNPALLRRGGRLMAWEKEVSTTGSVDNLG